MILEKPYAGWSYIHLFDLEMELSYLGCGNAPFNWLSACKYGLNHHLPATLLFYSERWGDAIVIADERRTSILPAHEDEASLLVYEDYNIRRLTEDIIMDISRDFDSWIKEWVAEPVNPYLSEEELKYMDEMYWQGQEFKATERLEEQLKTALRETESAYLKRKWKAGR